MRLVVLDTETTGLNPADGHRIVEIGCVEILGRRRSGRRLHQYVNPERPVDPGAFAVHGLSQDRLANEPVFAQIAQDLLGFVQGARLVIHNAPFDLGFLDAEFDRLGLPSLQSRLDEPCIDSLVLARSMHPGQKNSLDALCARYAISNRHRQLHGALLDAELLADVYLAMTRGQETLLMARSEEEGWSGPGQQAGPSLELPLVSPTEAEIQAHLRYVEALKKICPSGPTWPEGNASQR